MGSYNMDEVIYYDVLKCVLYPKGSLYGACDGYVLNFLTTGLKLPLLSWPYLGSVMAWIYLPIRLLWPSPFSARLLSFGFLIAGGALVAKRFAVHPRYIVIFLLAFFPYAFQHIVDTGPIAFQVFSTFVLDLGIRRTIKKPHTGISIGIGVLLGLLLWTKAVYAWVLPALFVVVFANVYLQWPPKKRLLWFVTRVGHGVLALACTALLFGAILFSSAKNTAGVFPLLNQLFMYSPVYSPYEMLTGAWSHSGIWHLVNNPLGATHRMYWVEPAGFMAHVATALLYGAIPFLVLLYVTLRKGVRGAKIFWTLVYYILFLLTLLVIARTKRADAMHHAILAYPFWVLSAVSILQFPRLPTAAARKCFTWILRAILGLFICVHLFFWLSFTHQNPINFNHPSLEHVRTVLNNNDLAKKYLYVSLDWGPVFIQNVYGPRDQMTMYVDPLKSEDLILAIKQRAAEHGRKVLFVYYPYAPAGNMKLVAKFWNLTPCAAFAASDKWQILAERSVEYEQVCKAH